MREEFQALKSNLDQIKIDYNRMKPTCLELEQQLETSKRMNQRLEEELIFYKNKQAERHDFESEQFNKKYVEIVFFSSANKTFDLFVFSLGLRNKSNHQNHPLNRVYSSTMML